MAKRAPILGEDYDPVGARLKKVTESEETGVDDQLQVEKIHEPKEDERQTVEREEKKTDYFPESTLREAMTSALRCRCTKTERKRWHQFSQNLTGEMNRFSHIFRAILLLLEHGEEEFQKLAPHIQRIEEPSKNDPLAMALYEQKVAEVLWEGIRRSGRPKF
jgi:hypothetical protein